VKAQATRLAAALFALAAAGAAGAQPGRPAEVEAWARESIASWRAERHMGAGVADDGALAAEAKRRAEAGAGSAVLAAWLQDELMRASLAFAPRSARHDPAARYALPFDPLIPRILGQGNGGEYSHTGRDQYAFDFVMPVGTPVRAAREGVVARVVDGFTKGGKDPALKPFANLVYVLHDDGTFGAYVHLSRGIPVQEGQRVARSQVIGRSGQTGFSGAPHLHFSVERVDDDGLNRSSLPIRFGQRGRPGFVPKQEDWVGFPPKPTVELALYADGGKTTPGQLVAARSGQKVRVRVEALLPDAPPRDVTAHPKLQLVAMTPWNLEIVGAGEAEFRPMQDFTKEWGLNLDVAVIGVFYLNREERQIGLGKLEFHLTDLTAPGPAPAR
jgi:murein DD-endopeptidase MepM/ murein hydrolase activator NlpD